MLRSEIPDANETRDALARAIESVGILPSNGNDQQDWFTARDLAAAILASPFVANLRADTLREAADAVDRLSVLGPNPVVGTSWLRARADALTDQPRPSNPLSPSGVPGDG